MAVEHYRTPIIGGIGVGTAWALHTLVHADDWVIVMVVALTVIAAWRSRCP